MICMSLWYSILVMVIPFVEAFDGSGSFVLCILRKVSLNPAFGPVCRN